MAFLVIPEILEMINKLECYIRTAQSRVQKRYFEMALRDLQKLLETMREENE